MKAADCHPEQPNHAKGLCKTCYAREHSRKRYQSDPAYRSARIASSKRVYESRKGDVEYRARRNETSRRWYVTNGSAATLRWRYGISPEEREEMFERQGGRCAICGSAGDLYIDHNHQTDEVRELLCPPCNFMLGNARESVANLRAGIAYLEKHGRAQ